MLLVELVKRFVVCLADHVGPALAVLALWGFLWVGGRIVASMNSAVRYRYRR